MYRRIATTILLAMSATGLQAQDQTLIGNDVTHGGFGGPAMHFTRVAGKDAFMMGGRGAYIVNGTFAIGGGGFGWSSNNVRARRGAGIHQLEFGYGGLELEYINRTREVVHWTLQLMIGGGGASQNRDEQGGVRDDTFFLLEPGFNVELNVIRGFRIGAGVAYRLVNGVNLPAFRDRDLSGVSGVLMLRFGKF